MAISDRKRGAVPTILIVDDEPGLLRIFANLANRLNCHVILADSGAAALDILDNETPDLLVLDLAMPQVSGFDVLRQARTIPRLDHMKVMILTARPNLVADLEGLEYDCWVSKPVSAQDFVETVSALLDET